MKKFFAILIASFALIALPGTSQKIEKKPGIERSIKQEAQPLMVDLKFTLVPCQIQNLQPCQLESAPYLVNDHEYAFGLLSPVFRFKEGTIPIDLYYRTFNPYNNKLGKKIIRIRGPIIRSRI